MAPWLVGMDGDDEDEEYVDEDVVEDEDADG